MKRSGQFKYIVDKLSELIKFGSVIGLLCFMLMQAPGETAQVVGIAAAFILGGKLPTNLKL